MHLKKLIENINIKHFLGGQNVEIPHVNYDSRKIAPGDLFVAIKGHVQDGHNFIGDAVSRGAAAVLAEAAPEVAVQKLTRISIGRNILSTPFPYHEPSSEPSTTEFPTCA